MEAPLSVRIEVEHMKYTVMQYLNAFHKDIEEAVSREIEGALRTFDFEGAVRQAAHDVVRKTIANYFSYGPGYTAVSEAVNESLSKILGVAQ